MSRNEQVLARMIVRNAFTRVSNHIACVDEADRKIKEAAGPHNVPVPTPWSPIHELLRNRKVRLQLSEIIVTRSGNNLPNLRDIFKGFVRELRAQDFQRREEATERVILYILDNCSTNPH